MIKVTLVEPLGAFPFIIEFGHVKNQRVTEKAAIELRESLTMALNKLQLNELQNETKEFDLEQEIANDMIKNIQTATENDPSICHGSGFKNIKKETIDE